MMKSNKPPTGSSVHPPTPATTRRLRDPRRAPMRPPFPHLSTPLSPSGLDASLQRWFEEEAEALQRLAHTQRLKGDYVAAQVLEKEIRTLAADVSALLQQNGKGGR